MWLPGLPVRAEENRVQSEDKEYTRKSGKAEERGPGRPQAEQVWSVASTLLQLRNCTQNLKNQNLSLPAPGDVCPEQWFTTLTHHWIPDQSVRNEDKGFKGVYLGVLGEGPGVQWWIWSYPCQNTIAVEGKFIQWYLLKRGKGECAQRSLQWNSLTEKRSWLNSSYKQQQTGVFSQW